MEKSAKLFFILILSNVYITVIAQTDSISVSSGKKNTCVWSLSFEQGAMLGNGVDISDQLAEASYYNGIDFHLGFSKTNHKDIYNQVYRLPVMGIGWYTSTFHQAEVGKPNALYYFFNMPIKFERSRKLTMSYLGAFGLSYNFNPYDSIQNPANLFIGSYRNCYVNFALKLNYHINRKWVADIGIGFKHFSNGSFKQPNYGINLVPVSIGLTYKPSEFVPFEGERDIPKYIRHNQFNFAFIAGSKNYDVGEPNYFKGSIQINWLRAFSYKYRGGVGFDIFYSAPHGQANASASNTMSYAIVGSWEWAITEHFYVPVALAFYLKRNEFNNEVTPYYERVGVRYRFNNKMFTGLTIKAHQGAADIFEWTIGYTLCKDANRY